MAGLGGGTDPTKLFENSSVVSLWLSQAQEMTQTFLSPVPIATLSVLLHSLGQAARGLEASPWIVGQGGSRSGPWQELSITKLSIEFRAGCQPPLLPKPTWVQSTMQSLDLGPVQRTEKVAQALFQARVQDREKHMPHDKGWAVPEQGTVSVKTPR